MHVVVAGGTGFLGRALTASLEADGHRVSALTRHPRPGVATDLAWTPDGEVGPWVEGLAGVDTIVNLAGEGIADKRWTPERKAALVSSRLKATTSLAKAVASLPSPPRVFVSASGVGYYGPRGDERITESAPRGRDFLADLADRWEQATMPAMGRTRVVLLRTGLVMGREGALKQMLPPFRMGVGGRLGDGRQWMPWIALDDWVGIARLAIEDARANGPLNLSAPDPVTNAEFTKTLGRVLRRPTIFPVPAFALKLAFGELADALLTGQRAVPEKARQLGYAFKYTALADALRTAID
jgi:uncharacterized protein (TIGR01777 family)